MLHLILFFIYHLCPLYESQNILKAPFRFKIPLFVPQLGQQHKHTEEKTVRIARIEKEK